MFCFLRLCFGMLDRLFRGGKPHADFSASLEYFRNIIEAVTPELYAVFESEARQRLRSRDESDWPILATALGLTCAVWTEDADFFGTWHCGVDYKSNRDFS